MIIAGFGALMAAAWATIQKPGSPLCPVTLDNHLSQSLDHPIERGLRLDNLFRRRRRQNLDITTRSDPYSRHDDPSTRRSIQPQQGHEHVP